MLKKITLVFLLLALSVNAQAALVDSADGSYFTDTSTGLQWLDLTATNSLTYNQVAAELGTGGLFDGYRFATALEVLLMFNEAGGPGVYAGWSTLHNLWAPPLMSMWGITGFDPGPPPTAFTFYFLEDDVNGFPLSGAMILSPELFDNPLFGTYVNLIEAIQDPNAQNQIGSALVSSSVVPVPAAVWLFGTALLGLVGFTRRRTRT